jgi:hypothetical protein
MRIESSRTGSLPAGSAERQPLNAVPALAGLSRDDVLDLAVTARRRFYAKGQAILPRHDPGHSLHIIPKGRFGSSCHRRTQHSLDDLSAKARWVESLPGKQKAALRRPSHCMGCDN